MNHKCESTINVDEEETTLLQNGGLALYQDEPFCGTTQAFYPDRKLAETIEYCQGKRHGKHQKWFSSGQRGYECAYENGILHGLKKSLWSNGAPRSEATFTKGKLDGKVTEWYDDGQKLKELNYSDGKEHGMQHAWRKNGKIYINYEAKNGRIYGLKRSNLCYSIENEEVQYTK